MTWDEVSPKIKKLALLSCERESVLNVDLNVAYNSNVLGHPNIADTKSRPPFPNRRSRRNGFSTTYRITENDYILTA